MFLTKTLGAISICFITEYDNHFEKIILELFNDAICLTLIVITPIKNNVQKKQLLQHSFFGFFDQNNYSL